ncbi:uncharacterized protein LOC141658988 [Silene latifolia]|uniref:uncharacterized protein LOC141658988 n=1 Tax=Silene latifolia TaxID=37657 RepID=UPI003D786D48
MPMLNPEAVDFFKKLTGLRSLEIDLPAMPCYDCRVSPHLWFKWDARFGVYDTMASSYVLYVFGDKADDNTSNTVRTISQMLRAMKTVAYHSMLHCSVIDLGCEEGHWKTGMNIMIKDAERNGSMMIGPKSKWGGGKTRFKIFHLPSTLNFSRYVNEDEDPVQAQDVMLLFLAHLDASVDQDDNDVIMSCLADMGGQEGEADQKTELRDIVAQFLADENCMVFI